jgi:hypothetical protein
MAKNEIVKDSGSMQTWETGCHRDNSVGKGRMDLVPMKYASMFMMDDPVLNQVDMFMETRDSMYLLNALRCALDTVPVFRYDEMLAEMYADDIEMCVYEDENDKKRACAAHVLIEVSKIYEAGAAKYQPNNWSATCCLVKS